MGYFIFLCIVLLVGVLGLLAARRMRRVAHHSRQEAHNIAKAADSTFAVRTKAQRDMEEADKIREAGALVGFVAAAILIVGVVLMVISSIATVPTRNIAVTTVMGKPTGTLGNGWHLIPPYASYEVYDATIQTPDAKKLPEFDVRIANNAVAKMRASVDWQVDPNADIQQLHLDWRNFDSLEAKVVDPRLWDALNKEFETYDPLLALKASGGANVSLTVMEERVLARLRATLPSGIIIKRLQIPFPVYPEHVQKALNDYQTELANTQVAMQRTITAAEQKKALDILASASMSPEAFLQQCLIVTERLAQQGKVLPPAWSCTGGASTVVPVR